MKRMFKVFALMAAAMTIFSAQAFAALSNDEVTKFIAATPDIETFAQDMKKEGRNMEEEVMKDSKGKFEPYAQSVDLLKTKYKDDYKKMGDLVKKHGFTSAEEWANVGDRVMHAYMAIKIEEKNPEALKDIPALTDDMKKSMPPETLKMVERQIQVRQTIAAVPKEDKDAVKTQVASLDEWIKRSEEQAAAANKDKAPEAKKEDKPAAAPKADAKKAAP